MSEIPSPEIEQTETLKMRFDLPLGFKTEMGSVYKYTPEGHSKRWKFDGTEHAPMGLAVFVDDTPYTVDVVSRREAHSEHLPPEKRLHERIFEVDQETRVPKPIFDIADVTNPNNLFYGFMRGNTPAYDIPPVHVNLWPKLGSRVFEIGKTADGRVGKHLGHKVTEIIPN